MPWGSVYRRMESEGLLLALLEPFSILRWKKRTNGVPLVGIEGIGAGGRDTELETVDRLQEVLIITEVVESDQFGLHLTVGVVGEDI